jgi:hypothetical protein
VNFIERAKQIANGVSILTNWLGDGGVPCDRAVAQKRAAICIACPKNGSGLALTESIANAIKANLELKSKLGLRVEGEKKLLSCGVCGCSNRLQVWCPDSYLRQTLYENEQSEYPEPCWKKQL